MTTPRSPWLLGGPGGGLMEPRGHLEYTAGGEPRRLALEPAGGRAPGGEMEVRAEVHRVPEIPRALRITASTTTRAPVALERLVWEFPWDLGSPRGQVRFVRNGWQSWSSCDSHLLDSPSPRPRLYWARRVLWCEPHRRGPSSSDTCAVLRGPRLSLALGWLTVDSHFGSIEADLHPRSLPVLRCTAHLDGARLEPGVERRSEVWMGLDTDADALLGRCLQRLASAQGARVGPGGVTGWCTWYYYYWRLQAGDMASNLTAARRDHYPFRLFQMDDGYQSRPGDWREPNRKFPEGIRPIAERIAGAGYRPGLWTAPFFASLDSRVAREHPEWLLRGRRGRPVRGMWNPMWSRRATGVLDTTHPEVLHHLEALYRELTEWGYTYHKLDFLYGAALEAARHDPHATRADALRWGLAAVRRGAGPDAFLLGCGCPLGPAVGIVDGMRVGTDVARWWANWLTTRLGADRELVSTRNGLRNAMHRAPMHRRLWLNDADCVMLRRQETKLTLPEIRTLASVATLAGGILLLSDDLQQLAREERETYGRLAALGDEVEQAGAPPRVLDLGEDLFPRLLWRPAKTGGYLLAVNWDDTPRDIQVALPRISDQIRLPPEAGEWWGQDGVEVQGEDLVMRGVEPHGCRVVHLR